MRKIFDHNSEGEESKRRESGQILRSVPAFALIIHFQKKFSVQRCFGQYYPYHWPVLSNDLNSLAYSRAAVRDQRYRLHIVKHIYLSLPARYPFNTYI
jgi:hypothetical protein